MAVGALAAAVVAGAALKSKGERKSANTMHQGFIAGEQAATGAIDEGYQDALKYISPYAQMGEQTLPYLQQLLQAPNTTYEDYFKSPEYAALSQQQEGQVLRNASATGGLRSGNAQVALASIAPQLAMQNQQYQNQLQHQRFGNAFDLTRFGAGFGQNAAQLAMNRGNTLADYRYNAATGGAGARAAGQQQSYATFGKMFEDLGTLYAGGSGGFGGAGGTGGGGAGGFGGYQAPNYFTKNYGWMTAGGGK